uniref:G_PROTEIN_RECEP_F1_2 domain-containing protein n=1 Tax=Rhabditophanes sp. KR3021 TaxID=114890 RepID=A0AC35TY69_9BILA
MDEKYIQFIIAIPYILIALMLFPLVYMCLHIVYSKSTWHIHFKIFFFVFGFFLCCRAADNIALGLLYVLEVFVENNTTVGLNNITFFDVAQEYFVTYRAAVNNAVKTTMMVITAERVVATNKRQIYENYKNIYLCAFIVILIFGGCYLIMEIQYIPNFTQPVYNIVLVCLDIPFPILFFFAFKKNVQLKCSENNDSKLSERYQINENVVLLNRVSSLVIIMIGMQIPLNIVNLYNSFDPYKTYPFISFMIYFGIRDLSSCIGLTMFYFNKPFSYFYQKLTKQKHTQIITVKPVISSSGKLKIILHHKKAVIKESDAYFEMLKRNW